MKQSMIGIREAQTIARLHSRLRQVLAVILVSFPLVAAANPVPISLDQEISDSILAGEERVFLLQNLTPGQRVFAQVTATSNVTRLNWLLEDELGRVIVQDLSRLSDLGPVNLMGGNYRLTVRGESPTVEGSFSFIAHAVNDTSSDLSLETLETVDLSGIGATHRFDLNLPQPEAVQLFFSGINSSQLSYRVTDELGNLRQDWTNSAPEFTNPYTLPTGTHRIEVRGRNGFEGSFGLQPRPVRVQAASALPLNGSANYSSTAISDTSQLQFTLAQTTQVYFTFTYSHSAAAGQWRLDRADGQEVNDWTSRMDPASEPFDLLAGTYVLSIRSRDGSAITGDANLWDASDAVSALLPDVTATAQISTPGQTHYFELSSTPDGLYLIDQLNTDNNLNLEWRLQDASGRVILPTTSTVSDVEAIALSGGDYVLSVSGTEASVGFVDFQLVTQSITDTPTSIGSVITEAITSPGEVKQYTFTAPASQLLSIDRQATSNLTGLNLMLHDAAGREIVPRETILPLLTEVSLAGGSYTLTVLGEGGEIGGYTLALVDNGVSGFTPSGTPLALGALAQDTIAAGATQQWLLTLPGPTRTYFELVDGTSSLDWSLFDSAGELLFDGVRASVPGTDDRGPFLLAAGDYTIEVEQPGSSAADYAFRAIEAPLTESLINVDQVINSGPTVPGFRRDYLFNVPSVGRYYFEVIQGISNLRWRLEHVDGERVFDSSRMRDDLDSQGAFDLQTGDYRLRIEGVGSSVPEFAFQIRSVSDLNDMLSLGAVPLPVAGTMALPGQRHLYDLTVEAGVDRVYVQVQSGDSRLRYSLIDAAGRELLDGIRLSSPVTDDRGPLWIEPGQYQLQIVMDAPTTSSYALTLHPLPTTPSQATQLGQIETWVPGGPGAEQRFSFSLKKPSTRVVFDPQVAASNAFVTLRHLTSGWQPFSDVELNNLSGADRGPYALPPGDYELLLNTWTGTGAPSWQLIEVIDEDGGLIDIDQVVDAGFATPGSTLSYRVVPEEDGQPLVFDQMTPASDNRWELIDPVGARVFGPANAENFSANDQGPIPLASGVYTLNIFNAENEDRDWLFRVASFGSIITVPEGCAACSALDVVFTFDTSPSMNPVNQTMCDLAGDLVQTLADDGIPINARFWGISGNGSASCLTSNVTAELGVNVPGAPPSWMLTLDQCDGSTGGPQENWGPAAAVVAGLAPWEEGAVRLLIPVADEGSYCGDPVDDFDIESVYYARQTAIENDVVISPLLPAIAPDPVRAMAQLITVGTGGISTIADFGVEDILPVARSIAVAACGTAQTIAAPEFTDLSPRPGALLPSNVPIVLSGRVLPVNRLRPVLEVEVNGQPSSVLDGSGAFFATIELQPGPNQVTISAVEACGPTVLEIELIGAGDDTDPWASFAEITDLLQAEFSSTTFDPPTQRLLVDVAARNSGVALQGPILMAVGVDLDPGVSLLNSDGITPNGEPYVVLVPEGEILTANGRSAIRELAFSNPELQPIDFEPRFLLPANQAPYFNSSPVTRATVARAWQYAPVAEDGDGDSLSFGLLVAPIGMTLSKGVLSWMPPAAGSFDVVLRVSDGRGGVGRQSFSINVSELGFNAPPIFTSAPVIQAPIGFNYSYQSSVIDPDGDSITYSLLSAPAGLSVGSSSGLLSWPNAQPAQHNVILQAEDGQGGQATQNFTLFIGEPATTPPGPAFSSVPVTFAAVETQYRYLLQFSPVQDPLPTITLAQGPAGISVDPVEGSLNWLPQVADLGPNTIELIATDSNGQQASQTFVLTVLEELPNQAPYLTSTPPQSAVVGQLWTYQASAIDPEFEDLTYGLAQAPAGMQIDASSGLLEWTPPTGAPSSVTVTLQVTDLDGLTAEQAFDIDVRATNTSPVLTSTPPAVVFVGRNYNHLFIAQDADGDRLTFSLLNGPSGMSVDSEAGWLSWSTAGVAPGTYAYELEVRDDWGGRDTRSVSFSVIADTQAPMATIFIEQQPACAAEEVTVCLQASDNVGLASRALQIDGQPQTLVGNCVNWTPSMPGNVPASATAIDVTGLSVNTSRTLQVADCNDEQKPVVTLISPQIDELILKPTPLIVSIDDNTPQALTWTVSIRAGLEGEPQVLAEGTGPMDQSEVALIDATVLPEGEYWVSILGSDGLQTGGVEFRINVGAGYKPGRLLSANADVIVPLAGFPLTIGRSYDSLQAGIHGDGPGDLGPGWRLALSGSVEDSARETSNPESPIAIMLAEPFSDDTRVTVLKPNGEIVGFTFAPVRRPFPGEFQFNVEFEPDPGVEDTLRVVDAPQIVSNFGSGYTDYVIPYNPSVYELETPEKVVFVISEHEGLIEIRDALGGILSIDADGIQSSRGPTIDYLRDSQGRIAEVLVPALELGGERRKILYGYDTIGNLETVTDLGGGVTTFEYDNEDYPHHLTGVIDQRGVRLSNHVFDEDGRMIAQCPADGDINTLEGCTTYEFDIAGSLQAVFDTRGFRSDLIYNENRQLILRRDWLNDLEWVEEAWVYDDSGNQIEYIDAEGGRTISEFDSNRNEIRRTLPGGQTYRWRYGRCNDYWIEVIDPQGNAWKQSLDNECKLRFLTDPLGAVTEYQYNELGSRTAIIDPLGQTWRFTYNDLGLERTMTDPRGNVRTTFYNNSGLETRVVDRNGQEILNEYDDAGQLITQTWAGTDQVVSLTYNEAGLLTQEASQSNTLDIEYWPTGRIRRLDYNAAGAPSWWVGYEYDGNGNVLTVSDSAGGLTRYEYDVLDRLSSMSQSGVGVLPKRVDLDYNRAGILVSARRFGDLDGEEPGPGTQFEYDCPSCVYDLTVVEHQRPDTSVIHRMQFSRDANGSVLEMADAEGMHNFIYDGRGWLVDASHPPVPGMTSGQFSWDFMGNWRSMPDKPGPAELSYDNQVGGHLLLDDGEFIYTYDDRGALIARQHQISGETLNIDYDSLNRATGVTLSDGAGTVISQASYGFTPTGTRTFAEVDGQERHFIYDGENVIAALDSSGQVVWRRFHARSIDRPFAVDDGSQVNWLLSDHNGSIRDVVSTSGSTIAHFAYDAFGRQVIGPDPDLDDSIRFTGREFDVPGGLAYYRARLYDPNIGRFISEDPLEPWHYRYAENNPLKFNDPTGEMAAADYAAFACGAFATQSLARSIGGFLEETFTQVVNGMEGRPVNQLAAIQAWFEFLIGLSIPCGLPGL